MGVLLAPTQWVKSTDELRNCLDPRFNTCERCQGRSRRKPTCNNFISRENRGIIDDILGKIVDSGSLNNAIEYLKELAALALCPRWHRDQASEKVLEWIKRLRSISSLAENDIEKKASAAEVNKPPSSFPRDWVLFSPRNVTARTIIETETNGGYTNAPAKPTSHRVAEVVIKREDDGEKTPLSAAPARSSATEEVCDTVFHKFRRYTPQLPVSLINHMVKLHLDNVFRPSEKPQKDNKPGFVYGYRLPSNHKLTNGGDCDLIKIGNTTNLEARMLSWQKLCGYKPDLLFAKETPHHVKMENIIHLNLRNERRQECGCPQCGARHVEFFDVDVKRARDTAEMWTEWAKKKPFDESGRLTEFWRKRLDMVDLEDSLCWEKFVGNDIKLKATRENE